MILKKDYHKGQSIGAGIKQGHKETDMKRHQFISLKNIYIHLYLCLKQIWKKVRSGTWEINCIISMLDIVYVR